MKPFDPIKAGTQNEMNLLDPREDIIEAIQSELDDLATDIPSLAKSIYSEIYGKVYNYDPAWILRKDEMITLTRTALNHIAERLLYAVRRSSK